MEIIELKLKGLISQMNPHFTFNTINSIQHYIIKNDQKNALTYLNEFASLMRRTLDYSYEQFISLEEEIDFLQLYVRLENKRFDHEVKLEVDIDSNIDVDQTKFPALLLQPVVENAIIYGGSGIDGINTIKLEIIKDNNVLFITITDSGSGKTKHFNIQHKKNSYGLDILRQRVSLNNGSADKTDDVKLTPPTENIHGAKVQIRLLITD